MRSLSVVVLLVLCVSSGAVQVKVGDRSFPLEAVKQLKELMDLDDDISPRLSETSVMAACSNPLLPQVFQTVCRGKGTGVVFSRLGESDRACKTLSITLQRHEQQVVLKNDSDVSELNVHVVVLLVSKSTSVLADVTRLVGLGLVRFQKNINSAVRIKREFNKQLSPEAPEQQTHTEAVYRSPPIISKQ
ncbi:hypothetical protein F2P81_013290 [Scophthalmus maximus]|uniref:Guanylate cyclase activator 2B n=1 Tax=Scophthalmus maximus TaxID=52904 RepID=A0A6A4SZX1_SCOMX|nr:hypothetical protein F2P81_013290 [Scophthalmus maximus]